MRDEQETANDAPQGQPPCAWPYSENAVFLLPRADADYHFLFSGFGGQCRVARAVYAEGL